MHIQSIPMCEYAIVYISAIVGTQSLTSLISSGTGSSNNYAYLVVDDKSRDAVIIDPAHPEEYVPRFKGSKKHGLIDRCRVTPVLKPQVEAGEIKLTYIMNTHQ